jgi:hypothetical protein
METANQPLTQKSQVVCDDPFVAVHCRSLSSSLDQCPHQSERAVMAKRLEPE